MTALGAVVVMAVVGYALRAVPLIAMRRRITNTWVLSFLHYVPPAVLTAMTVPAVFFATDTPVSGVIALATAVILAVRGRPLMVVALGAALSVLLTEVLLTAVG